MGEIRWAATSAADPSGRRATERTILIIPHVASCGRGWRGVPFLSSGLPALHVATAWPQLDSHPPPVTPRWVPVRRPFFTWKHEFPARAIGW